MIDRRVPMGHPVRSMRPLYTQDWRATPPGALGRIVSSYTSTRRNVDTYALESVPLYTIAYRTARGGTSRVRTFGEDWEVVPRD